MKKELLNGLSEEQIEKVKACKNPEELFRLAKEEDIELTEEQLAAINGGACSSIRITCPWCGSYFAVQRSGEFFHCEFCDCTFTKTGEIHLPGRNDRKK